MKAMIQKLFKVLVAAGAVLWMQAGGAAAQEEVNLFPKTSIAVIDIEGVLRASTAYRESLAVQVEKHRAAMQEEVRKLQMNLEESGKGIESQRAILSAEAYQQKVKEWQEERSKAQKETNIRKQKLDKAFLAAKGQITAELDKILAEYIRERKINLVLRLDKGVTPVYSVTRNLNISADILKLLNEKIQSVTFTIETSTQ